MTAGFNAIMSCNEEGKVHTRILRLADSGPPPVPLRTPPAVVITADDSDGGQQDPPKLINGAPPPLRQDDTENSSSPENLSVIPSEQQLHPGESVFFIFILSRTVGSQTLLLCDSA